MKLITYEQFIEQLMYEMGNDGDAYLTLLEKVIDKPTRFAGLFRLSNPKNKLIQNITQSKEIRFGDFMENIFTYYFDLIGYKNYDKSIEYNKKKLLMDQFFERDGVLYLIEQKMRDDHDANKKRGQMDNFKHKYKAIRSQPEYKDKKIVCIMWFTDDTLKKNYNYYKVEISKMHDKNAEFHLFYGKALFDYLKDEKANEMWDEITKYLKIYKDNQSQEAIEIPDFGTSEDIYKAMLKLSKNKWEKLISDETAYVNLRKEMFSSGDNIEKALKVRGRSKK